MASPERGGGGGNRVSELGKEWQGRLALGQLCCYNMARSSNYAPRHVKPDANPSGAVAPPPLAGEAFFVGKRERGRFMAMHNGTSSPTPTYRHPTPPAFPARGGCQKFGQKWG